jgi:hypothetical protein
LLKWDASHFGKIVDYLIYRFEYVGEFAEPAVLPTESIGSVCASIDGCEGTVPTEFTDFGAPAGRKLAYFVRTVFEGEEDASDKSNYATITTPPAVLNFDGFADLTVLTNQYASEGISFTGATVLNAGGSLNAAAFPPRSGTGVIFDFDLTFGGVMTVAFTSPVRQAGGYVTGNTAITLDVLRRRRQRAGKGQHSRREFRWLRDWISAEHLCGGQRARHCKLQVHRPRQ